MSIYGIRRLCSTPVECNATQTKRLLQMGTSGNDIWFQHSSVASLYASDPSAITMAFTVAMGPENTSNELFMIHNNCNNGTAIRFYLNTTPVFTFNHGYQANEILAHSRGEYTISSSVVYNVLISYNGGDAGGRTGTFVVARDTQDIASVTHAVFSFSTGTLDMQHTPWKFAMGRAVNNPAAKPENFGMGSFWLSTKEYVEFAGAAGKQNRLKFFNADGTAKYWGKTGACPTGTQPDIYFDMHREDWSSTFVVTNYGSLSSLEMLSKAAGDYQQLVPIETWSP